MVMVPGSRTRFVPSRAGYRALAERGLAQKALLKRAEAIKEKTSPRMGGYARTLRAVPVRFNDQAGARVTTSWPFAHLDEWGSANNAPYASMRRGVDKAGLSRAIKLR